MKQLEKGRSQKFNKTVKKRKPVCESNIFRSVENVNLSTVIAYKKDGIKHNFLDEY